MEENEAEAEQDLSLWLNSSLLQPRWSCAALHLVEIEVRVALSRMAEAGHVMLAS